MKLRNWLPTKFLTEENPVIGLSFEVGYARMAVMVGEAIIFTMSNMIRGDYDSVIYNCMPAIGYRQMGGFERDEFVHIHAGRPRGFLQHTGKALYGEAGGLYDDLLELRREYKANNAAPSKADIDRMHRRMNSPYLYPSVGTVGHRDYGRFPTYLTRALIEKQMRDDVAEIPLNEYSYTVKKLFNNGRSGVPRPESGHSSLTAMCRTSKFRLTDTHGGMGVAVKINFKDYMDSVAFRKVGICLAEKYYYTGEGMLPKDL